MTIPAQSILEPMEHKIFPSLSIVIPVYSGAATLPELVNRLILLRSKWIFAHGPYLLKEVCFVCDEPVDLSSAVLNDLIKSYDWIKLLSLSKNCGQHMASAVGIIHTTSDWILTIDEDLEHPPELALHLLRKALVNSLDIVYARPSEISATYGFRSATSNLSKKIIEALTQTCFSDISSFRLIRADAARPVANSIDSSVYLDVALLSYISRARISTYSFDSSLDGRPSRRSSYKLSSLLSHFSRFVFSARLSFEALLKLELIFILFPAATLFVISIANNAIHRAPGWLSLFFMLILISLVLVAFSLHSIKMLSLLSWRSLRLPPYLLIDRSSDPCHLESFTLLRTND